MTECFRLSSAFSRQTVIAFIVQYVVLLTSVAKFTKDSEVQHHFVFHVQLHGRLYLLMWFIVIGQIEFNQRSDVKAGWPAPLFVWRSVCLCPWCVSPLINQHSSNHENKKNWYEIYLFFLTHTQKKTVVQHCRVFFRLKPKLTPATL